jgi:AcrR family transcriptional regulator
METHNVDRRVRRTKKLLLQGLTKLMSEKKINKITVKELTQLVDVNRATFYIYYKDIFDMLEKVETEMFEYFSEALEKYMPTGSNIENALSLINYVFKYIEEYSELCKILLGPDGDYAFVEKLKKAIGDYFPVMERLGDNARGRYFMPFVISGCVGAIQQWLEDDMKTSSKDMANFVFEMSVAVNNGNLYDYSLNKKAIKDN